LGVGGVGDHGRVQLQELVGLQRPQAHEQVNLLLYFVDNVSCTFDQYAHLLIPTCKSFTCDVGGDKTEMEIKSFSSSGLMKDAYLDNASRSKKSELAVDVRQTILMRESNRRPLQNVLPIAAVVRRGGQIDRLRASVHGACSLVRVAECALP
jgi:hypothetical protein